MELLKYFYFCAQKSIIKAGNNKFQDLINAPRIKSHLNTVIILYSKTTLARQLQEKCQEQNVDLL